MFHLFPFVVSVRLLVDNGRHRIYLYVAYSWVKKSRLVKYESLLMDKYLPTFRKGLLPRV